MASTSGVDTGEASDGSQATVVAVAAPKLTDAQRARVERNRQRALLLKQSRLTSRPYPPGKPNGDAKKGKAPPKVIDTGGGFLLEEEDAEDEESQTKVVHQPGAMLETFEECWDQLLCEECGKEFLESYLYSHFDAFVCDKCRDSEEKHKLITKTEAKNKYLLKDVDLDKREPLLKYIVKKNPRNQRWGDMKLYLESQVAERALTVWGSDENMEEARDKRVENKDKLKQKKFDKKMKDLRMSVRSSLFRKDTSAHEHDYDEETYDDEEDTYSKTCTTCGQSITYEKM